MDRKLEVKLGGKALEKLEHLWHACLYFSGEQNGLEAQPKTGIFESAAANRR